MDHTTQPKKRGRKKKTETFSEKTVVSKVEQPQVIQAKNIAKSPGDLQFERERLVKEFEANARKVDNVMEDPGLMDRVYKRMKKKMYGETCDREDELEKLKMEKSRNAGAEAEWETLVVPDLVSKICSVIDFLLENGPMTRVENDILSDCIDALKSYYITRSSLILNPEVGDESKGICMRTTFYPKTNTSAYRLLSDALQGEEPNEILNRFRPAPTNREWNS